MGGHSVPEDKIVSRYQRSLDLLVEAIQFTNLQLLLTAILYFILNNGQSCALYWEVSNDYHQCFFLF